MITVHVPRDWRDLQACVARILEQCDFDVALEQSIETVRGQVEVDVYAEEGGGARRRNIVICECKLWRRRVPKSVVHGFRTVVADFGANTGFIISVKGFQLGAFAAADCTNVQLVTWEQFQEIFEQDWLKVQFGASLKKDLEPLIAYTDPFGPDWFDALSNDSKDAFRALRQRHIALGLLALMCGSDWWHPPPIGEWPDVRHADLPEDVLTARGYGDLKEALLRRGHRAMEEFWVLKRQVVPQDAPDQA